MGKKVFFFHKQKSQLILKRTVFRDRYAILIHIIHDCKMAFLIFRNIKILLMKEKNRTNLERGRSTTIEMHLLFCKATGCFVEVTSRLYTCLALWINVHPHRAFARRLQLK